MLNTDSLDEAQHYVRALHNFSNNQNAAANKCRRVRELQSAGQVAWRLCAYLTCLPSETKAYGQSKRNKKVGPKKHKRRNRGRVQNTHLTTYPWSRFAKFSLQQPSSVALLLAEYTYMTNLSPFSICLMLCVESVINTRMGPKSPKNRQRGREQNTHLTTSSWSRSWSRFAKFSLHPPSSVALLLAEYT